MATLERKFYPQLGVAAVATYTVAGEHHMPWGSHKRKKKKKAKNKSSRNLDLVTMMIGRI